MTQQENPQQNAHKGNIHVVVNGEHREVSQAHLTFDEVCKLAFPDGPFGENIIYTVTYSTHGRDGSLVSGENVEVVNGMIFHVGNTDKS